MEADAEVLSQALCVAPGVQSKRGRRDYISNGGGQVYDQETHKDG